VQRRSVAQRQRAAAHRAVNTMWSSWTAAAAATRLSEHTAAIIGAPLAHALGRAKAHQQEFRLGQPSDLKPTETAALIALVRSAPRRYCAVRYS
jgi:hypothetical protein